MKTILTAVLCVSLVAPALGAATRAVRRHVPAPLSITFENAGQSQGTLTASDGNGWLELPEMVHQPVSREPLTRVRRRFAVRIDRAGQQAGGTARLTARLESWDGRALVLLNGRRLTAAPQLVDAHVIVGQPAFHQLEITVAVNVPAGPLAASIAWEATAN